jgi:hypothetical protein
MSLRQVSPVEDKNSTYFPAIFSSFESTPQNTAAMIIF